MKKTLLCFLFSCLCLAAEPISVSLKPVKEGEGFSEQLIDQFALLLQENEKFKAEFDKIEEVPQERAGGRYLGYELRPLLLHSHQFTEFRGDGGSRDYSQTVVLYVSFGEGMRRGMEESAGVFAVFQVTGEASYSSEDTGYKTLKEEVKAEFKGFQKTLAADLVE